MPGLNHKGPEGNGPKTGRKLGKCKQREAELKQSSESGQDHEKRLNLRKNRFEKNLYKLYILN
jgi:hypothetical protein